MSSRALSRRDTGWGWLQRLVGCLLVLSGVLWLLPLTPLHARPQALEPADAPSSQPGTVESSAPTEAASPAQPTEAQPTEAQPAEAQPTEQPPAVTPPAVEAQPTVPARLRRPAAAKQELARAEDFVDRPITRVELLLMGRRDREKERALRRLIVPKEGQPLSRRAVSRTIELLYRQGAVSDALAEVEREGEGVRVRFKVWPAVLVRRVIFQGNRQVLDRTLNAQLTLREGSVYSFDEARAQAQLLQRFYVLEGFRRAKVTPEVLRAGRGRMDVRFRCREGEQTKIQEIRFEGNEVYPPRLLQQLTGLEEQRSFRTALVEEARLDIQRFYRTERYLEARVRAATTFDSDEKRVTLSFTVEEGTRVKLEFMRTRPPTSGLLGGRLVQLAYKTLPGLPKDGVPRKVGFFARQDLLNKLELDDEQQFTDASADDAAERIRSLKVAEGADGAEVTWKRVLTPDGLASTYSFVIDPGERIDLGGFTFTCETGCPPGSEAAKAQETLWREALERFSPRDTYTAEALEQALLLMTDYYRSQGYLDARVTRSVTLRPGPFSRRADIAITIQEGPRTLVTRVVLPDPVPQGDAIPLQSDKKGPPPLTVDDLKRMVTLHEGAPYDPAKARSSIDAIRDAYARRGYLHARVSLEKSAAPDRPTEVLLALRIEPGTPSTFGEVIIRGTRVTRQEVIRREVEITPGQLWDPEAVERSRQNLSRTGLFQRVSLYPIAGERVRDVMVEVTERKSKVTAVSAGLQFTNFALDLTNARVDGALEYTHFNVGGHGHRLSLRFELASFYPPTLPERAGEPIIPDYLLRVGQDLLSYVDKASSRRFVLGYQMPWFLGRKLSANWTATLLERERQASWLLERNSLAGAFSSKLGPKLSLLFQVQGGVRRPELEETDPTILLWDVDEEVRLAAQVGAAFLWDRRDQARTPRWNQVGTLLSVQGELGQLWGCGDTFVWNSLTPCSSEPLGLAEGWVRGTASGSFSWFPLRFLRLEARAQGGYVWPVGDSGGAVPIERRFFLGGANTVRGYAQDWLGPHRFRDKTLPSGLLDARTAVPTGGNLMGWYSTEVLIPLGALTSALEDFELALFRDAGNVFWQGQSLERFEEVLQADAGSAGLDSTCATLSMPDALKVGLGVGLRMSTSIGPMRVDLGFPQGALCAELEPPFVAYFSIGQF